MKKSQSTHCTIKRIVTVQHSTFNLRTGKRTKGKTEVVTQECGTPLFGEATGICRSCAQGWEVKGNRFASKAERARAIALLQPHLRFQVEQRDKETT